MNITDRGNSVANSNKIRDQHHLHDERGATGNYQRVSFEGVTYIMTALAVPGILKIFFVVDDGTSYKFKPYLC